MLTADYGGIHLPLGWGKPAFAFDAYVEFRHIANDAAAKTEDRKDNFYSLAGALRYFGEDELDVARKKDTRARILQGPPFTAAEDERASRLLRRRHVGARPSPAASRVADPVNAARPSAGRGSMGDRLAGMARRADGHAEARRDSRQVDRHPGGSRARDGRAVRLLRIRRQRQAALAQGAVRRLVARRGMSWPTLESGALDETDQTFRDMAARYPFIEPLRELRYTQSKLRLNALAVGNDGRNRTLLTRLRDEDRPQRAIDLEVRVRPRQMDPAPDPSASRPGSHSPGFQTTGTAHRRRLVGRPEPVGGLRNRRKTSTSPPPDSWAFCATA